ncbi:hypothetical protein ALC57_05986 [Trachymyrmex cornetzi]|uniref:Uncharacterized protein n=1 Tax=Trachymyrmex cornetzi TaxID=471704 RepID=A0A151J969_9HYME|nr:hypothetical protein ALC57_05986 [Trachymyrmex cornetzi]
MSPIKKHRNMSNHQEMKHRRRKPNIPELVYKFLIANEAFDGNEHCLVNKCRCDQGKHHKVTDPISTIGESIGCRIRQRWRKDIGRISKLHNINQCPISKNRPILYLQKCMDRKHGTKEAEKYMKKALNFGVESGYLIPSDPTYRIVHVSSDLMKSDSRRNKQAAQGVVEHYGRDSNGGNSSGNSGGGSGGDGSGGSGGAGVPTLAGAPAYTRTFPRSLDCHWKMREERQLTAVPVGTRRPS